MQRYARSAQESAYPQLWDGLVGAWVPAFGATGTKLLDISGYKHHLSASNINPSTDWVSSLYGSSIDFANNADAKFVGITTSHFAFGPDFTIIALYKRTGTGEYHILLANEIGQPTDPYNTLRYSLFVADDNKLGCRIQATAKAVALIVPVNEWSLCAVKRTGGSSLRFWLNRDTADAPNSATMTDNGPIYIGDTSDDRDNTLGKLAFSLLYNYAVPDEYMGLFNDHYFAPFIKRRRYWGFVPAAPAGANPKGPFGVPFHGPFGGPL